MEDAMRPAAPPPADGFEAAAHEGTALAPPGQRTSGSTAGGSGQGDILVVEHGSPNNGAEYAAAEWEEGEEEQEGGSTSGSKQGTAADASADALAALQLKEAAASDTGSPADSIKAHKRRSSCSAASGTSRSCKRLTFTAPPKCLNNLPRAAQRANYSHSQQRVRQILRDNERLVKRLGTIAVQHPEHERSQEKHDLYMTNVATTSASRRRNEANRLMQQNLRIYGRLQAIKPSRDVARGQHERDFEKHERMLATLAALRRRGKSQMGGASKRQAGAAGAAQAQQEWVQ